MGRLAGCFKPDTLSRTWPNLAKYGKPGVWLSGHSEELVMSVFKFSLPAAALAASAVLAMPVAGSAVAAPLGSSFGSAVQSNTMSAPARNPLLTDVQYRRGYRRGYVAPRYGYRRGWAPGAAVGLGILGGAAMIGAATARPYYYDQCWVEARPVYDRWGNYIGDRNIRVCN